MNKRNLFAEMIDGFDALANVRTGKQTLPIYEVEHSETDVTIDTLQRLECSAGCDSIEIQSIREKKSPAPV